MVLKSVQTSCIALVALLVAACGADDPTNSGGVMVMSDATGCPEDTPPFELGPTGLGASNEALGIKVYLESASHIPPAFDFNDWTVALTDTAGAPLQSAQITWACAFMPLHFHGSNPKAVNDLGGGKFELQQQNLAMYGKWLIRLWVDPSGEGEPYEGSSTSIGTKACSEPGTEPTLEVRTCVPQ